MGTRSQRKRDDSISSAAEAHEHQTDGRPLSRSRALENPVSAPPIRGLSAAPSIATPVASRTSRTTLGERIEKQGQNEDASHRGEKSNPVGVFRDRFNTPPLVPSSINAAPPTRYYTSNETRVSHKPSSSKIQPTPRLPPSVSSQKRNRRLSAGDTDPGECEPSRKKTKHINSQIGTGQPENGPDDDYVEKTNKSGAVFKSSPESKRRGRPRGWKNKQKIGEESKNKQSVGEDEASVSRQLDGLKEGYDKRFDGVEASVNQVEQRTTELEKVMKAMPDSQHIEDAINEGFQITTTLTYVKNDINSLQGGQGEAKRDFASHHQTLVHHKELLNDITAQVFGPEQVAPEHESTELPLCTRVATLESGLADFREKYGSFVELDSHERLSHDIEKLKSNHEARETITTTISRKTNQEIVDLKKRVSDLEQGLHEMKEVAQKEIRDLRSERDATARKNEKRFSALEKMIKDLKESTRETQAVTDQQLHERMKTDVDHVLQLVELKGRSKVAEESLQNTNKELDEMKGTVKQFNQKLGELQRDSQTKDGALTITTRKLNKYKDTIEKQQSELARLDDKMLAHEESYRTLSGQVKGLCTQTSDSENILEDMPLKHRRLSAGDVSTMESRVQDIEEAKGNMDGWLTATHEEAAARWLEFTKFREQISTPKEYTKLSPMVKVNAQAREREFNKPWMISRSPPPTQHIPQPARPVQGSVYPASPTAGVQSQGAVTQPMVPPIQKPPENFHQSMPPPSRHQVNSHVPANGQTNSQPFGIGSMYQHY